MSSIITLLVCDDDLCLNLILKYILMKFDESIVLLAIRPLNFMYKMYMPQYQFYV